MGEPAGDLAVVVTPEPYLTIMMATGGAASMMPWLSAPRRRHQLVVHDLDPIWPGHDQLGRFDADRLLLEALLAVEGRAPRRARHGLSGARRAWRDAMQHGLAGAPRRFRPSRMPPSFPTVLNM